MSELSYPTEAPDPYALAKKEWDNRIGTVAAGKNNWQRAFFGAMIVIVAQGAALAYRSVQTDVRVVVSHETSDHKILKTDLAEGVAPPDQGDIAEVLTTFTENVRNKPADGIVIRKNWDWSFNHLTSKGADWLRGQANARDPKDPSKSNDPLSDVGNDVRDAQVYAVVPLSATTFQVRWTEKHYEKTKLIGVPQNWTGIYTVTHLDPPDANAALHNPHGIYIDTLLWKPDV